MVMMQDRVAPVGALHVWWFDVAGTACQMFQALAVGGRLLAEGHIF